MHELLVRLFDGLHLGALLADVEDETTEDDTTEDESTEEEEVEVEEEIEVIELDVEDLDEEEEVENEELEDAGTPKGLIVSTVARCAPVGPGFGGVFAGLANHGAFVVAAAHGNPAFSYGDEGSYDLTKLDDANALCDAIAGHDGSEGDPEGLEDETTDETDTDAEETSDIDEGDDETLDVDSLADEDLEESRVRVLGALNELRQLSQGDNGRRDEAHARRDAPNGQDDDGDDEVSSTTSGGPPAERGNGRSPDRGGPPSTLGGSASNDRGPGNGRGPNR